MPTELAHSINPYGTFTLNMNKRRFGLLHLGSVAPQSRYHLRLAILGEDAVNGHANVQFLVRRAKARFLSGCESRPARSLQPVAIGAAAEATKRLKPPV
jgi:hypothetical protein